ncbi:MAG TPA: Ig-like domain-containing protein, partial [Candidatus Limnocylindrales bacterium]|nr:Ig-like domain-containing protein [Candidatus Limnocylindrales bacterium]
MPNRRLNVVARRGLAAATSGLILAGALMPAATAAAGAPPVLRSDYINTLKNVTTTGNVLANDKDPSGGGLVFDSFTPVSVSVGTLTIASNGAYSFSPATNWTGTASTTYQAHNTNRSRTGNIYITVRTENAAPVANDDVLTLGEDSTTDVTADILANDTDVDGDTLWVTGVSGAVGGTVDLTTEIVTFTASADLCGSSAAGFDYTITDGFLTAATGHVTVDITCANDDPTAVDDDASGTEDTNVTITASDLAADDTDPDTADALTVTAVSNPSGGTVSLVAGTITFVPT